MRKIPMRKCVATQEQLPKKELIRIVRTPQMEVKIDESGSMNGTRRLSQAQRGGSGPRAEAQEPRPFARV